MLCQIIDKTTFTDDIFSVTLKQEGQAAFEFKAGQYAVINLPDFPEHDARPYSIASAPDQNTITFHIKSAGRGISGELFKAEKGVRVQIDMPYGAAFYRPSGRPVLLIGGGLGLAPLLSILHNIKKQNPMRAVYLCHGAYTADELYLHAQLTEKAKNWSDLNYFGICETPVDGFEQGRIGEFSAALHNDLSGFDAYLSGPPAMVSHCFSLLQDKGLKPEHTYSDALDHEIKPFAKS